jgi:hypothetical protein
MSISIMKGLDALFFEILMIVVNKSLNNLPGKTVKWVSMDKFVNKLQTLYYRIKGEITKPKPFSVEKKGKSPLTIEYTLRRSTHSFPPQLIT